MNYIYNHPLSGPLHSLANKKGNSSCCYMAYKLLVLFFSPFNSLNLKRLINLCVCYNLFYLFNGYENALHYLNILVL